MINNYFILHGKYARGTKLLAELEIDLSITKVFSIRVTSYEYNNYYYWTFFISKCLVEDFCNLVMYQSFLLEKYSTFSDMINNAKFLLDVISKDR